MAARPCVILGLPDRTEGALIATWLSENQFEPVHRTSVQAVANAIQTRAFDLLITDVRWAVSDALQASGRARHLSAPVILIGDPSDGPSAAANTQAMCLTRPIELGVLSCFVSMALIDSRPVRRSQRKAVQPFEALVNNVAASIVDVSAEGLRLELPRVPPPYFGVRIPLLGVAFIAKRMWTMSASKQTSRIWCGGELSNNQPGSEQAWRSFVDTVPIVGRSGVRS